MPSDFVKLLTFFNVLPDNPTKGHIDTKKLDSFIISLTDVYIKMLKEGLMPVQETDVTFESTYTKSFFMDGFNILRNGNVLSTLSDMLNFQLFFAMKSDNLSIQEKFEIFLLSKIIPHLQPDTNSIENYICFFIEFCSHEIQFVQIKKFKKSLGIPIISRNPLFQKYLDNSEIPPLDI